MAEAEAGAAGIVHLGEHTLKAFLDFGVKLDSIADQLKTQRAVTAAWVVDGLSARVPLRAGVDRRGAIDVVWLLMEPAVFDRLITDRGWTPQRFGAWFADSALRLITACSDNQRGPAETP